jgi:hypothetical protein
MTQAEPGTGDLVSTDVLAVVPRDLVEDIIGDEGLAAARPAPGVRDGTLHNVGAMLVVGVAAAADGATLILARDQLRVFGRRLLLAMRRARRDELEVSCRVGETTMRVLVTTDSDEIDIVRLLGELADALAKSRAR